MVFCWASETDAPNTAAEYGSQQSHVPAGYPWSYPDSRSGEGRTPWHQQAFGFSTAFDNEWARCAFLEDHMTLKRFIVHTNIGTLLRYGIYGPDFMVIWSLRLIGRMYPGGCGAHLHILLHQSDKISLSDPYHTT